MFTRADIEAELIQELGPIMAICKLNATVKNGTNASLEGPIRRGVISCGGTIAAPPHVTDDDVATVTADLDRVVYLAKYHLLRKLLGNWPHVDMKKGETDQRLDQLAKRIREWIEDIKKEFADPETSGGGIIVEPSAPEVGVIKAGLPKFQCRDSFPFL